MQEVSNSILHYYSILFWSFWYGRNNSINNCYSEDSPLEEPSITWQVSEKGIIGETILLVDLLRVSLQDTKVKNRHEIIKIEILYIIVHINNILNFIYCNPQYFCKITNVSYLQLNINLNKYIV
jgi:hypothetical protein